MNLREMIDRYRVLARDSRRPYLCDDAELVAHFNEAQDEASMRASLLRDFDEFDIAAGDTEIEFDCDANDIEYVELRSSAGEAIAELHVASIDSADKLRPFWRTVSDQPEMVMPDGRRLVLGCASNADYKVFVEFFRKPKALSGMSDTPEFSSRHHPRLIDWVMFRAYSKPDADIARAEDAAANLAMFEKYFGRRKSAVASRESIRNKPHRNKCHL